MGMSLYSTTDDTNEESQNIVFGVITSPSTDYLILSVVGEGSYGKVFKCEKTATREHVAVKVFKNAAITPAEHHEVAILQYLMSFDPDKFNFVACNNIFTDREHLCVEFEILDQSLIEFVQKRPSCSLYVKEIRPILFQGPNIYGQTKRLDILKEVKPVSHLSPEDTMAEMEDRETFVDLVRMMLNLDSKKRITPSQMLEHPFITMRALADNYPNSFYVKSGFEVMGICRDQILRCDNMKCGDESVQLMNLNGDANTYNLNQHNLPAWLIHQEHPLILKTASDMSRLVIQDNQSPQQPHRGDKCRGNINQARKRKIDCSKALQDQNRTSFTAKRKKKKTDFDLLKIQKGVFQTSKRPSEKSSSPERSRKRAGLKEVATQTESYSNSYEASSRVASAYPKATLSFRRTPFRSSSYLAPAQGDIRCTSQPQVSFPRRLLLGKRDDYCRVRTDSSGIGSLSIWRQQSRLRLVATLSKVRSRAAGEDKSRSQTK
ncbi:homeodomain-interacting protein kinase 3-like [Solea senegalensis]|uniref:Homeodomain-interacting protein kinase 3-like n=1 Tax=Solea senegalensis TaxID=28829 RepID=A0AAV6PUV0_SOLSE|nr:homeodomain-interacting protein kinase 3-like [Solea senegalensis]